VEIAAGLPLRWNEILIENSSAGDADCAAYVRRLDARVAARSFDVKNNLAVWPRASPLEHFVSNARIAQG
jgi:hypothetical protein